MFIIKTCCPIKRKNKYSLHYITGDFFAQFRLSLIYLQLSKFDCVRDAGIEPSTVPTLALVGIGRRSLLSYSLHRISTKISMPSQKRHFLKFKISFYKVLDNLHFLLPRQKSWRRNFYSIFTLQIFVNPKWWMYLDLWGRTGWQVQVLFLSIPVLKYEVWLNGHKSIISTKKAVVVKLFRFNLKKVNVKTILPIIISTK